MGSLESRCGCHKFKQCPDSPALGARVPRAGSAVLAGRRGRRREGQGLGRNQRSFQFPLLSPENAPLSGSSESDNSSESNALQVSEGGRPDWEACHPQLQQAGAGTGVPEACFAAMPNSVISSEVRGLFSRVLAPLV